MLQSPGAPPRLLEATLDGLGPVRPISAFVIIPQRDVGQREALGAEPNALP